MNEEERTKRVKDFIEKIKEHVKENDNPNLKQILKKIEEEKPKDNVSI